MFVTAAQNLFQKFCSINLVLCCSIFYSQLLLLKEFPSKDTNIEGRISTDFLDLKRSCGFQLLLLLHAVGAVQI